MTMKATEWTKQLETGILWQDFQHKELVANLQKLFNSILNKTEKKIILKTLKFLDVYIEDHFGIEEKYMAEYEYPQTAEHMQEHRKFSKNYLALKNYYENPTELSASMLCYDLNEWIIKHIKTTDRQLGEFLKQQKS